MKVVARVECDGGALTVTDVTAATPRLEAVARWGLDHLGRSVRIDTPSVVEDDDVSHFHCVEAVMMGADVYAVDDVPVRVTPMAPGVELGMVVAAAAGGRAPGPLLHQTARVLLQAAANTMRDGFGSPGVWFGVDGVVAPLCPLLLTDRHAVRLNRTSTLTLASLAPELVRGQQEADELTLSWAVGVALHGLAFGVLPWTATEPDSMLGRLQASLHGERAVVPAETALERLIVACTHRERGARPRLDELAAVLGRLDVDDVDLRPTVAGLCGPAWQAALDVAEQLPLIDDATAPRFSARRLDLTPWREWLRNPLPPGVQLPLARARVPARLPF